MTAKLFEGLTPEEMLEKVSATKGETRQVNKCKGCGTLFVSQFIPFAIGRGKTYGQCICNAAGRTTWTTELEIND